MRLDLQSLMLLSPQEAASAISGFVEALVALNLMYLKANPQTKGLYESGMTYVRDEPWRDIPSLLSSKQGDCKSLVAWRIAELRLRGYLALVHVVYTPQAGEDLFHVQVRRKGQIEDPSRFLGMR